MEFPGRQRSAHVSKSFLSKSVISESVASKSVDRRVNEECFDFCDLIDSD